MVMTGLTFFSKTRNSQFKTLHRIIATNDFLNKVDIVDNNLCTFCDLEIETLEHLFYHCTAIIFGKKFLNGLSRPIRRNVMLLSCLVEYYPTPPSWGKVDRVWCARCNADYLRKWLIIACLKSLLLLMLVIWCRREFQSLVVTGKNEFR